jgi:hypothetical protein
MMRPSRVFKQYNHDLCTVGKQKQHARTHATGVAFSIVNRYGVLHSKSLFVCCVCMARKVS